jgi:hypothetical protein
MFRLGRIVSGAAANVGIVEPALPDVLWLIFA